MVRILFYTCLFLLLSTALTSFGWYLACNKPCDPEIIITQGDTVWIKPEPIAVFPVTNNSNISNISNYSSGFSNLFKSKILPQGNPRVGHKVKKGENLYRIGLKYGITAEELRLANKLANYDIKTGQRLTIPKPSEKDTVYTYHKEFGDSTVKGSIWTQSYGPILSQSVEWKISLIKPKTRLFGGVSLDDQNRLNGIGAIELKSGFMITGQFGQSGYQVGFLKRLK